MVNQEAQVGYDPLKGFSGQEEACRIPAFNCEGFDTADLIEAKLLLAELG
jgi:hypothetical protein